MKLRANKIGQEGWCAIFDALRDNPQNKIVKWDLYNQGINPTIAKSLSAYAAVSASLTAIDVGHNKIDQPSARLILEALKGKDMQSIGMAGCNLGVEEAKTLAEYARVMASLTEVRRLR